MIDGSRPPRTVTTGEFSGEGQFLPKRRSVLISRGTQRGTNLAIASLDRANAIEELTNEPGYAGQATPSLDGEWLAFVTDRTGRSEVMLGRLIDDHTRVRLNEQRFPVSPAGGIDPHWRADGREIVYLAPDRTLMAVAVTINVNAVSLGRPVPLFRVRADAGGWGSNWTGNADHTKFVAVDAPHGTAQTFRVLTNWLANR